MNDIWVCDSCKSINRQRDDKCYHCRASRSGAMETPGLDLRATNAAAERSVRSYVISWPLALITIALLAAVSVIGVVVLRLQIADFPAQKAAFVAALTAGQKPDTALTTQSVQIGLLSVLSLGLSLLALVPLAGWMGLVARNVPLLGGGTPSRSPVRVFVYTLIPIFNLYRVPGMLQDLLYRVDPREGGAFMVIAATIGLVGSRFLNWFGGWMITAAGIRRLVPQFGAGDLDGMVKSFGDILDQSFWLAAIVAVMSILGTIILAGLMIRVESRCAARDREIRAQMAASGAPALPTGPSWQSGQPGATPGAPSVEVAPSSPVAPSSQTAAPAHSAYPGPSSTTISPSYGPSSTTTSSPYGPSSTTTSSPYGTPPGPPPPPPGAPRPG